MKIAWFDRKPFVSSGRFGYFRSRARLSAVPKMVEDNNGLSR
jgi:hypothetical protein